MNPDMPPQPSDAVPTASSNPPAAAPQARDVRRFAVPGGVALALLAAAVLTWPHLRGAEATAPTAATAAATPRHAAMLSVTRADLAHRLEVAAEFRPFQQVDLRARVAGYVRRMHVDVGDRVKAGALLAELDAPELEDERVRALAAVTRSEQEQQRAAAAYDDAHLAYTRLAAVSAQRPNLVAGQDLDSAAARDRTAHAAWIAAGAALAEARAAVTRARDMIGYCRIVAPFDGIVTARYTDPGALLGGGTTSAPTVVRVTQVSPLRLVLPVPASAVPNIHVGDRVDVRVDASDRRFTAPVARMSGEIRADTRTMQVEVDVANDDFALSPGMFATASLDIERHNHTLALPIQVLGGRHLDKTTVLVVDAGGRLAAREIHLGLETARQVEVTAGLQEGERVLAPGQTDLHAGDLVITDAVGAAP